MKLETLRKFPSVNALYLQVATQLLCTLVEQDHSTVKRVVRPMLGFKLFWAVRCTIAGIEIMLAMRKGQLATTGTGFTTPAERFYALAA